MLDSSRGDSKIGRGEWENEKGVREEDEKGERLKEEACPSAVARLCVCVRALVCVCAWGRWIGVHSCGWVDVCVSECIQFWFNKYSYICTV